MTYWLSYGYHGERVKNWHTFDTLEAAHAAIPENAFGVILNQNPDEMAMSGGLLYIYKHGQWQLSPHSAHSFNDRWK